MFFFAGGKSSLPSHVISDSTPFHVLGMPQPLPWEGEILHCLFSTVDVLQSSVEGPQEWAVGYGLPPLDLARDDFSTAAELAFLVGTFLSISLVNLF